MSIIRVIGLCVLISCLSACVTTKSAVTPSKTAVASEKANPSDTELGRKFLLGRGVHKNDAKAFYYFKRAADAGDALAQNEVAYLLASGKGTPQSYHDALKYYQQAANQNLASAQYSVGLFYLHGLSVPQNQETALVWFRKAASHGFEPATHLLKQLEAGQKTHEG